MSDQQEREEQPGEQGLGGPDITEPGDDEEREDGSEEKREEGLGGPNIA